MLVLMGRNGRISDWSLWTSSWGSRGSRGSNGISDKLSLLFEEIDGIFLV